MVYSKSLAILFGHRCPMTKVTRILESIERGEAQDAEQLLPLVYNELRKLAAQMLSRETPGQTLDATALVHEAYVRLVNVEEAQHWHSRSHFFAAAAESMRRILVETIRRKQRLKHGGGRSRERQEQDIPAPELPEWLLDVDEALDKLAAASPQAAELVKLRYFSGFTNAEAAALLGFSARQANRVWAYARAWLREELDDDVPG